MSELLVIRELVEYMRNEEDEQAGGGMLPPGFRFHPTDEELITFYLAPKVFNNKAPTSFFFTTSTGIHIAEVDLNRFEPWELPDVAKMGEREWYLFSLRDRKYPTGVRTNRSTGAGYWKATGKDREVKSSSSTSNSNGSAALLIGMKKTLVFYKGRAPRGEKTKWVMHEYHLHGHFSYYPHHHHHTCKEEEWVICRIVNKRGYKRTPLVFQGQSYHHQHHLFQEACSSPTTGCSLTPLLENTTTSSTAAAAAAALLLESQYHDNPFDMMDHHDMMDHQNQLYQQNSEHLQTLMNNQILSYFPINEGCFSPNPLHPSTTTTTIIPNNKDNYTKSNNNHHQPSSSSSILFNSLLSHQEEAIATIPKQYCCKTEANISGLFQLPHANLRWVDDKVVHSSDHSPFANPLFFGMDCGVMTMGWSSSSAAVPDTTSTVPVLPTTTTTNSMAAFNNNRNRAGIQFQTLVDAPPPPLLPSVRSVTGQLWPLDG